MLIGPHIPFISRLRSGTKIVDEEINAPLELTLVEHCKPPEPFKFVGCTFNESPNLPKDPPHGHPALIFNHCIFKKSLKLDDHNFHRELTFIECRFERYVDFTKSRFFQGVSFEDCSFDEKAYFEKAFFGINLEDRDAYKNTNLKHCCSLWLQGVAESRVLHCHPMDCNTPKHDHGLKACANFRAAVFNDGAEFDHATFYVPVCFHKTTWHEATTFLQCQFPLQCRFPVVEGSTTAANIINFSHAQISGSVEFNQSLRPSNERPKKEEKPDEEKLYKYGEVSEKCIHANFKYIHIHKEDGLRFHTENLKRCSVLGTNLDACHFSNVRWPKIKTYYPLALRSSLAFFKSFSPCKPSWIGFRRAITFPWFGLLHVVHIALSWPVRFVTRWVVAHRPDEEGSNRPTSFLAYCESCLILEQYCIWDHEKQNQEQGKELSVNCSGKTAIAIEDEISRWRNQWALLSRAYRDLKTAYEGNKDYIYASDFHYAEKEFRRINYQVPRQIRIQLQLYWLVSGYGERVLRPIWWFLIICILGAVPYYLWGKPKAQLECVELCRPEINPYLKPLFSMVGSLYAGIGSTLSTSESLLKLGGWGVGLLAITVIYLSSGGTRLWELIRHLLLFGLLFGVVVFGIDILSDSDWFNIVAPRKEVCFREALRYSAESMGLLKPEFLDLGEGLTWPRIWSWAQALAGPFLFVMFSLALKNKLKR